jgi:catechol 2,3-dioxygenase-like lactoylglutathione lyase family enzyme
MPTKRAEVSLDHIVLEVTDPMRSVEFYRDLLGFRPVRVEEFLEGKAPFPSARVSRRTILDFFPRSMWRGRKAANPNHFCVSMDGAGVASLKRKLARRRIPIDRRDDHNFGARGFGRALYFRDPDGITIEARYYP